MPWVKVVPVSSLRPGDRLAVEIRPDGTPPDAFPLEIVVWRTAAGVLSACDGRCPHQWSNLADEGEVQGEELVCTAHHWRFDVEGRGTKRNVLGRRDPKSDVPTHPVREELGTIELLLAVDGKVSTRGAG